jgi:riboflavin-specific deaminase-like protein
MNADPDPAQLTPLLVQGDPRATAPAETDTAAEIVERLRLWEHQPAGEQGGQGERARVLLNMVSTADGRATVHGRSGPIGNRADRELFHALRTAVDAVLVGAGTVRAERYHALVREQSGRQLRRDRGLAPEPFACIVTASLSLPPDIPLLADPGARVVIVTPSADLLPDPAHPAQIEYVRAARDGLLDLPAALAELRARLGIRTLLCEGGPHLNGELLAAGLVDELFLSLAPKLAGGEELTESPRIVRGPELDPPVELELLTALESESNLLLRYRVRGAGGARSAPASSPAGSTAVRPAVEP